MAARGEAVTDRFCPKCDWCGSEAEAKQEPFDIPSCQECGEPCVACEMRAEDDALLLCPLCDAELITWEEQRKREEQKLAAWKEWASA